MEVSPVIIGIIGWIALLVLLFLEMPVGIALFLVSFVGIWCISGLPQALHVFSCVTYKTASFYLWSLIPLFILMGQLARHTGLGSDLFDAAFKWLGHFRGGLAITTIGTSTGFGAVCGDNIAAATTMTSVCLPGMRQYKYDDALSLSSICSGGILSFLIPPSLGFIIYGILANQSIGKLFIAGIFPGILCAIIYMIVIYIICRINPMKGPAGPRSTWTERLMSLKYLWGVLLLVLIIFGGIYSGFITPTEAGALGAFGALIIGLIKRRLSWRGFGAALVDSVQTVGMVFLLILGAWNFAPFLALSTIPAALIGVMEGWSPGLILLAVLAFYFFGGMIFEAVILMIITVPLFLPLWTMAGFDLIWFGVVLMLVVVTSGNTPPVGLIVYIVGGMVPEVPVDKIFRQVAPFVVGVLICAALVIAFPQIATFLPNLIG